MDYDKNYMKWEKRFKKLFLSILIISEFILLFLILRIPFFQETSIISYIFVLIIGGTLAVIFFSLALAGMIDEVFLPKMKVSCLRGVIEEGFGNALHMFRNDYPQCKGCVANFKGRCTTNTVLLQIGTEKEK